uniref:SANTA domain-containing protein n=1 Tax=Parastrongyloides trichosuri TaxID=131310 RepID=A0A0N5A2W9_PARTI
MVFYENFEKVELINWSMKFHEIENDFFITLEGLIGQNSIGIEPFTPYKTNRLIGRQNINNLFFDNNTHVIIRSSISKTFMERDGFTVQFMLCFKYGFPSNWTDIIKHFLTKRIFEEDVTIPNDMAEIAFNDQIEYQKLLLDNAPVLNDWYLRCVNMPNGNYRIWIGGILKEKDDKGVIEEIEIFKEIRKVESDGFISCIDIPYIKINEGVDIDKMIELGYSAKFIKNFLNELPDNYEKLFHHYVANNPGIKESFVNK